MPPSNAFTTTYLALLAMLWVELEELLTDIDSSDSVANLWPVQARAEAVLLETELLRECCDKEAVRAALTYEQRTRLRTLLNEILALLDLKPMQLPNSAARRAIMLAQNRVFDEAHALAIDSRYAGAGFVSEEEVDAFLEHRYTTDSPPRYAKAADLQRIGGKLSAVAS